MSFTVGQNARSDADTSGDASRGGDIDTGGDAYLSGDVEKACDAGGDAEVDTK